MTVRTLVTTLALTAGLSGLCLADVTGKVKFDGKPPAPKTIDMSGVAQCAAQHAKPITDESVSVDKDGGLKDVVVSIKNAPEGGKAPEKTASLDQKGCQYVPHVVAVMVGQKFVITNSDAFLHNVHGLPEQNAAFNFAQPNKDDKGKPVELKVAEDFGVKCDVHPWMNARIYVFEHPYFAVTGEDGTFAIAGLKDGEYEVTAQHPKLGAQDGKVTVKDGKGTVDFAMKPEEGAAADKAKLSPEAATVLTLLAGEKSCCDASGSAKCEKPAADVAPAAK